MKLKLITLIILYSLFSYTVQAVPSSISYQGYLTDPSGSPVDGTVSIVFSLYDADNAGSLSWTETQATVQVNKGLFKVQLGAVNPFASGQFDIQMWLGIKVGTDAEMTPLTALNSVGYAIKAEDAETLAGLNPADLDQSAHLGDTTNPHGVTSAQTGAASIVVLGAHTSNSANPHNVTAAQTGAASVANINIHSGNSAAHHPRYADSEAVSAMALKADNNPLHHDKYTNAQAVVAIKADTGTGLNADTVDNLHANEIIDAASDEVRTPISSLPYSITESGSYYVTQTLDGSAGGIDINIDNVTIDLMGYTLNGNLVNDYGIRFNGVSAIVIKNGIIRNFGLSGIDGFGSVIVVKNVQVLDNGSLGVGFSFSGIYIPSKGTRIVSCIAKDSGGYGIFVGNSSILKDNIVENSKGISGISVGPASTLSNNTVNNSQTSYAGIAAGSGSILRNNTVDGSQGTYGIVAGAHSTLNYNIATNNKGIGIYGSDSSILSNNTASRNKGSNGIYGGMGSILSNNTVTKHEGLYSIYGEKGSILKNNTSYANDQRGIFAGAGSTLSYNTALSNGSWGIYASESNTIIGNTLRANNFTLEDHKGGLRIGNDSLVESNTAEGNYQTGIYVSGTGNMLRKNHATNSVNVNDISNCIYFASSDNAAVDNSANGCVTNFSSAFELPPASRYIGNISWI